ncbi:MAG: type I-E CRISPR-associated protein Cse2/CasB [Deltaproteobacteria bacterium]|nr:type I-E CRISPR-associated protein Cse2/CasB [Deltaproteobacteria bacterium]
MTEIAERLNRFLEHLESLRDKGDRGALAQLRRGLANGPEQDPGVFRHVFPFVAGRPRDEDVCLLLASLFALHPEPGGQGNMGDVFRRIRGVTDSDSVEGRFMALLNCRGEDLSLHLRHAVSLAKANDVPVNWKQLLTDLRLWDHERRFVQRDWARGYWGRKQEAAEPSQSENQN